MPELPEVETTLRGLRPPLTGHRVTALIIRFPRLRWPIQHDLPLLLQGQILNSIKRRGKYLLFKFKLGTLILHLGMSGRVCVLDEKIPIQKHDHVDIVFQNGKTLRFTDPRRFGALLWTDQNPNKHPLLIHLGPEPLTSRFTDNYLWEKARGVKRAIKIFIMDGRIVAGVGNIYATEALFTSGINPAKAAGKLTLQECARLCSAIKSVLRKAIKKGGTTLKDFANSEGKPGYFVLELLAYGRNKQQCPRCRNLLKTVSLGQRSTVFCPKCQK